MEAQPSPGHVSVSALLVCWAGEVVSICSMPGRDPSPSQSRAVPDSKGGNRDGGAPPSTSYENAR